MKHPYKVGCTCGRCTKEAARREAQGRRDNLNAGNRRFYQQPIRRRARGSRRPIVGSAEWAETRGDDIPSLDQPGDDFDME